MRTNPALDAVGAHPIAAVQQRARDLRSRGEHLLDFSIGDPREPTWQPIRQALERSVPEVSQYPTTAGLGELREAVAGYVRRRLGVEVDPATQVMPTSGSKEAIFSSALAFVDRERGDAVGHPDPGYPVYRSGAVLAGATAIPLAARDDFVVTADAVADEVWPSLAMLWLCTPSNPTGAVTPAPELDRFVERGRGEGVLICSDECYLDLYDEEDGPPPSVLQSAGPGSHGVLAYLSLSKRSGMTGYRSGAVVGDPAAIERLHRLRTSTGTASPEFIQEAAMVAWADDGHVAGRRRIFAQKRRVLAPVFEEAGMPVGASRAGIYLWVSAGSGDDVAVATRLLDAGVVVSPGSVFGERGRGHLRLALVPTVAECEEAAGRLARLLVSWRGEPG